MKKRGLLGDWEQEDQRIWRNAIAAPLYSYHRMDIIGIKSIIKPQ